MPSPLLHALRTPPSLGHTLELPLGLPHSLSLAPPLFPGPPLSPLPHSVLASADAAAMAATARATWHPIVHMLTARAKPPPAL
jgi:hypothetical protein